MAFLGAAKQMGVYRTIFFMGDANLREAFVPRRKQCIRNACATFETVGGGKLFLSFE